LSRLSSPVCHDSSLIRENAEEATLPGGVLTVAVDGAEGNYAIHSQLAKRWFVTQKHAELTRGGLCGNDGGLSRPQHGLNRNQFHGDVSHVPLPTSQSASCTLLRRRPSHPSR